MDRSQRERVERVLARVAAEGRRQMLEGEVYEILGEAGIPVPSFIVLDAGASEQERLRAAAEWAAGKSGVVVKIQSPDILHKTEAGGIAFSSADPEDLDRSMKRVLDTVRDRSPRSRIAGLLLCEKIAYAADRPGAEMLLSMRQDPAFGPVVVVGIGGLLTEWFGSIAPGKTTWIVSARDPRLQDDRPIDLDALGPAVSFLARASRVHAAPPIRPERLWRMIRAMADLAMTFSVDSAESPFTLAEIEVNPMALVPGGDPVALDGVGSLAGDRPVIRRRRVEKVRNLLAPRSAAVVGASAKGMNVGRIILQNLRAGEGVAYGHIHVIHPKEKEIDTIPCVPAIRDLPERVDLAVVAVPAEGARDAIRDFVELEKAHSIILIPGGFAETGAKGLAEEIVAILDAGRSREDGGPVMVGGNCLGIVSKRQYNTFFLPHYKLPFHDAPGDNLAAVSQSGAYLVTFTSNLDGVIFPKASISYGNQMDLTVSDFLEHYLEDSQVQVIACYLEGFQPLDGARFLDLTREHRRRGRTVIVFKVGKTPFGAQAAASHTASLAGDYAVARSLLAGSGAVVAETLNQFEDFSKIFTMLYARIPGGNRVGVISNAGFECSVAMDALFDLVPAPFSQETRARLAGCLPNIAHADNPVDATPMATTQQFVQAVEAIAEEPAVDALVVSPVPVTPALNNLSPDPIGTHGENIYAAGSLPQELMRVFRSTRKPMVVCIDSGRLYDEFAVLLQRAGIPVYRKIDRAMRALSRYCAERRSD